jgi:hypothetical protein
MANIRDILFWILILAAIAVAIWLFLGSPTIETGLLMIVIFIAGSEILLWKNLFNIDKRTAIGFELVKSGFEKVNNKLEDIENLIKNKK